VLTVEGCNNEDESLSACKKWKKRGEHNGMYRHPVSGIIRVAHCLQHSSLPFRFSVNAA